MDEKDDIAAAVKGGVLALWHDEKAKNVHYAVVRLHDLDEARLTRIEAELAEIKQLLRRGESDGR